MRNWVKAGAVALATTFCFDAGAQSASDKAAAEALFDAGKKALKEKRYEEACSKLQESQKLDPGIGTLLYLGDCFEKSGRSASAWATFREGAALAKQAGDNQRERVARKRAERLEGKLSKMTISVADGNGVEGFVLSRDGAEVNKALWGTAIPVDPGEHKVEASAPGKKPWSTTVQVGADQATVTVTVPLLEDAPEPEVVAPPESEPAPAAVPVGPSPPPGGDSGVDDGSGQRTLGIVVGAVGLIGVGVGTVFALQAKSKDSDADAECRPDAPGQCTQAGVDLGQEAEDKASLATIAFGVGVLALVGGVVLYSTAPSAEAAPVAHLQLAPVIGKKQGGIFLGGRF